MKVIFESIKFKNILSFGNKLTTFDFINGIDLVIGENGMGKSTLNEAITYNLFGRPFRKIKMKNLINNKNRKDLYTELIFSINNKKFKIIRGMKPDIFEIYNRTNDWELIKKPSTNREYQHYLEENILMFNENIFRQLIVLGANLSSSKNFMDLSSKEKEEVLQVITDTAIFNKINEVLKERKNNLRTFETEFQYKVEISNSNYNSARINIESMEKQNKQFNNNKNSIISNYKNELSEKMNKINNYPSAYEKIDNCKIKAKEINNSINNLKNKLNKLDEEENKLKIDYRTFISNEENKVICPDCDYEIKDALPFTADDLKDSLKKVLSNKNIIQGDIDKLQSELNSLDDIISSEFRLKQNERSLNEQIKELKQNISNTEQWKEIEIDYKELEKLENEFNETSKKLIEIRKNIRDVEELMEMVSDKNLKGIILNQQLPFLNKYINEFLELFDSKFNFVIDNEFNEKIISRNSDNEFNSLSNGQKQRISLSILFSFLRLIEEKNGVSTNLLILDEYLDSSLDIGGINEVMSILDTVFSETKDVILISHNPDIKNRVELLNRAIKLEFKDGFSSMTML